MGDLTQQLVEQIQHAHATKTALNIQAGNTKASLGRHTSGQVIDVSQHTGVLSYNPTELVITARAGTKIEYLNDLLAQTQQRLPFEPPAFAGEATIGGTVAANQSGPSRPWFGSVKDSLLGLGLINGYGQAMQFGGQVMKNVAGFDVTRLQCGAMGGLGLITQVSIKLLPAFKLTQTLTFEMTAQAALDTMQHCLILAYLLLVCVTFKIKAKVCFMCGCKVASVVLKTPRCFWVVSHFCLRRRMLFGKP